MAPNNRTDAIWRLPLPDDWEPEGTWCVTISVPADQEYVDRLTAALGLLAIQKTWARDDTRTGAKIVAYTWEKALYGKPWLVVKDGCDYADPIVSPVITDPDDKADQAVAIITFIRSAILQPFVTCAGLGTSCSDCTDSVMTSLAPYGGGETLRGALMNVCAAVHDATDAQRAALLTDCPWIPEFNDLASKEMSVDDWLNNLAGWLFGWLNESASTLTNALNNAAGVIGGNGIQSWTDDHGGVVPGSGATFGATCPWTVDLDLTTSEHLFELYVSPPNVNGSWAFGVGYHDEYDAITNTRRLYFAYTGDVHYSQVVVTYSIDTDASAQGINVRTRTAPFGSGSTLTNDTEVLAANTTYVDQVYTVDMSSDAAWLVIDQNQQNDLSVTHLTISGTGFNPWA